MKQDLRYLNHLAELGKGNIHPFGNAATELLIDSLKIEIGNKLLEIGCGTGNTMIRILSAQNVTVDGIDVLPEMLKKAQQRLKVTGFSRRGNVFGYNGTGLFPFENSSYDRIYAESVLGFGNETDLTKLLGEIHRVLKKDGVFAANDAIWKSEVSAEDIERINKSCIEDFGLSQGFEQPWKFDDWLCAFKEAGFEILSCDLLETGNNKYKKNLKIIISDLFSNYYSLLSLIKPTLRKESAHFRRLLEKHSDDGKYIESRLFVLKKL